MDESNRSFQTRSAAPSVPLFGTTGLPVENIAALKARPGFAAACHAFTDGITALYQGNRLLNTLVSDRGRSVIGNLALYLHYDRREDDARSGLTVSRLKTICAEHEICSPGRIEAFLALLRLFGQLEAAPTADDRRVRRLIPTARMLESHRQRWRVAFAAIGEVLPVGKTALASLEREAFVAALVRHFAEHYLSGIRLLHHSTELKLFAERNAGVMVLFSVLQAGDAFPPRRPVTISISDLARRFGVSRVHVRTLLRDAEAEGFLERLQGHESTLLLQPQLIALAENFLATTFLFTAHCAQAALDDIGLGSAQPDAALTASAAAAARNSDRSSPATE